MKYCMQIDTPLGSLFAIDTNGALSNLDFASAPQIPCETKQTPLLLETAKQLAEYFSGSRTCFDLPLHPVGTAFQLKVWKALHSIPYGETCSYRDIAVKIGHPLACRAVGGANNRNPISIITSCHRVIGVNGSLTGYGGGLEAKSALLELEKKKETV